MPLRLALLSLLPLSGSGNELSVSYFTNVAQLFEVTLDMESQTASLSVDGEPRPEAQDVPFIQGADTTLKHLGGDPGLIDLYQLAVDDIHITCVPEPALALAQLGALTALGWLSTARRRTNAAASPS